MQEWSEHADPNTLWPIHILNPGTRVCNAKQPGCVRGDELMCAHEGADTHIIYHLHHILKETALDL